MRNNYAAVVEKLQNHDRIIITNRGKGQAVLINFEDYALYEENLHRQYVADALRQAEEHAAQKDAKWLNHDEFWNQI